MRFAGNFNPEWGYVAPAPSFIRTVRIVLVAAAVGATASAAVVVSLVDRPAAEESVAARTLARSTDPAATPPSTASQAVPLQVPTSAQVQALAPAATDAVPPQADETTPDPLPAQKKTAKKQHSGPRGEHSGARGPLALLRSFTARATTGAYFPRGEY